MRAEHPRKQGLRPSVVGGDMEGVPGKAQSVRQPVPCPCGDWEFRRADASQGLSATERYCPRHEGRVLIVSRTDSVLGASELHGHDARSYLQALEGIEDLRSFERRHLLEIAQHRAAGLVEMEATT